MPHANFVWPWGNILIYDENSSQFSIKKAREFYTNSTGETINLLELLNYCYINPNYESISPHDHDKSDKKMDNHDDMKMETSEKEMDTETTEEDIGMKMRVL